jgi:tetratricopeptide (TPR) repeat protein
MTEVQGGKKSLPRPFRGGLLVLVVAWVAVTATARAQQAPPGPRPSVDRISAETELSLGVMDFEKGLYERALERLGKADPAGPGAAYYRGLSLLALKRAKEALRDFEAVRKQPRAPGEVELDLGAAQLSSGDSAGAVTTLKRYTQAHPNDPYGHFFLGVALFRQRQYNEAIVQFQRSAADSSLAPFLDFYKGLTSIAQGETSYQKYFDRFRNEVRSGAPAELAQRLSFMPTRPGAQPGQAPAMPGQVSNLGRPIDTNTPADRHWNLAILNAYEYDTNVPIAPAITPLGLGSFGHKIDSRYFLASFADYRVIQRENIVLGLIGSTYDSFQFRLHQFNVQDYMGGTYLNTALLSNFIAGVRYEYHQTLLGGRQFLTDQRFTPNSTFREGTFGHTTVFYEFEPITVKGLALIPAQIRTGNYNAVGATQAVYLFRGAGRFFLGYRYENARTVGSDFDRSTNQFDARIEIPLPWKVVFDTEARYFWDDYKHPNSLDFFHRVRRDGRIYATAGLQKFFTPHISARLDYYYTDNTSNVRNLFGNSFYSYNRNVFSAVLIFDF